jgi:hypothetical protein
MINIESVINNYSLMRKAKLYTNNIGGNLHDN